MFSVDDRGFHELLDFDVHDDSNMLMGYFHYRLKTINRDSDIHHMYKLHELKLNEN